jgi:hypothetical protein
LNLTADLTIGPAFPAMVPALSPDSPGSAKELVYGKSNETYVSGDQPDLSDLPTPSSIEAGRTPANPAEQKAKLNLLAVFAVRVIVNDQQTVQKDEGSLVIDVLEDETYDDSVLDITKHIHGSTRFTFPHHEGKNSRWIVVAVYYRGTLQVSPAATLHMTEELANLSSIIRQSKSHFEQNADTYTQELAHVVDHLSEDGVRVLAVSS